MTSGPEHTYCSGELRSIVDYILIDVEATSMVSSCCTHTMSDLNTSDDLPSTVSLIYNSCTSDSESTTQRLPKDQAKKTGAIEVFKGEAHARMSLLLNNMYDDGDQMSDEIEHVAGLLTSTAEMLLPHVQPIGRRQGGGMIPLAVCVHRAMLLGGRGKRLAVQQKAHSMKRKAGYVEQ